MGANRASAQTVDPKIHFKVIETSHFSIIFDSRHRLLAELYADYAEEAYSSLVPKFNEQAPTKTVVFIDDVGDLANGSAVGVPYPMITAFAVLPSPSDPVSDYGNWGRELLMHEFTHVLNFEPANGVFSPFRYIFGSLVRPNMFLPRWYLEGLAVEEETQFSNYGRLRSPNFTAQLRAMSLDGTLEKEDISRINEVSIPTWPGGTRPYLMGSLLWDEIVRAKDEDIVGKLNDRYSRRMPFFISGPINDEIDRNFQEILDDAYKGIRERSLAQKSKIEAESDFHIKSSLKQLGFDSNSPSISPDQKKLVNVAHSEDIDSFIEFRERKDNSQSFADIEPKKILEGSVIQKVSWLPNSNEIIFDSIDIYDRYYHYSDLYKFNITNHKKERLTKGLRAREPAVSKDGQHICFVELEAGKTNLSQIRADGSNYEALYSPEIQHRISRPEFLNEHEIVFSERNSNGVESLKIIDLSRRAIKEVLPEYAPAHFSKMTAAGFLFESEKSGVANIYIASSDFTSARPITNAVTAATTADIDTLRQELLVTTLSGKGQNISSVEKQVWQNQPTLLPLVSPLIPDHWKTYSPPEVQVDKNVEEYSAWQYLYPRYWLPFFYFLPGGSYFSATTGASDPIGHHVYSLLASYDTLSNRPSIYGSYTNNMLSTPLTLNLDDYYEYIYTIGFIRHNTLVNPLLTSFIPGLSNNFRMGFGWDYFQSDYLGNLIVRNGPSVFVSYSNAIKRGLQISPETGGSALLSYTTYVPQLGNIDYEEANFHGAYYFSKFLPRHHVLAGFANLYYAPRLQRNLLGRTTSSAFYQQNILDSSFVLRGYPYGALIGHNLYSGNLEYRFPIKNSFQGYDVRPLFFQKYYGAFFIDAASTDGFYYSNKDQFYLSTDAGHYFVGTGAEFKADTTIFYQIPVTLTLGLYYGFDPVASYGFTPFIGFTL